MYANLARRIAPPGDIATTDAAMDAEGDFLLGRYGAAVAKRLVTWEADRFAARLWQRDATLWPERCRAGIADRLGWLELPAAMQRETAALAALARELRAEGIEHVVWLGMGGSSLAARVFRDLLGTAPGFPELIVLDSTHPGMIAETRARLAPARSFFVAASKSGTTLEVTALVDYFWDQMAAAVPHPGRHFAAVSDPGTPLARLAEERLFRDLFLGAPTVGGRYAALSVFGLLPAALIGADLPELLRAAGEMAAACGPEVPAAESPGLLLGACLGELALAGRDKLTFIAPPALAALPHWLEQLVAESTGKDGRGIVPIVDEAAGPAGLYRADRVFVALGDGGHGSAANERTLAALAADGHPVLRFHLGETAAIAAEMFRWEVAVAAAAAVIGVDPFDQPDVELSKDLSRAVLRARPASRRQSGVRAADAVASDGRARLAARFRRWRQEDGAAYVAIEAFLAECAETTHALQRLRRVLGERLGIATTLAYGPRYLHASGQLHKGGPSGGLFLQLVDTPCEDQVSALGGSFGALIAAQALGDCRALQQHRRTVLRVRLVGPTEEAIAAVAAAAEEALAAR